MIMAEDVKITSSQGLLMASFEEWCRQNGQKPCSASAVRRFTSEHFLGIIEDREIWRIQYEGEPMGAMIPQIARRLPHGNA